MAKREHVRLKFDMPLLLEDLGVHGWSKMALARQAEIPYVTVQRFFSGAFQTPRVAKQIAMTLGYPLERYVIRRKPRAVA